MVPLSFLPYDIAACTSYSEEGHPNQLAAAAARGETDITANNKAVAAGWLSQRFCTYPQVVVLRLKPGTCRIRKLEVLVHHFMISTKLEFYIGKNRTGDDWDFRKASAGQAGLGVDLHTNESSVTFEHLGFVSLNDGVEVAFKARELKSIHIDAEGDYLKIVVHKCWVNNLNLYNQIGLVAVSMFGERCRTLYESDFENFQQQSLLGLDQLSEIVPDVPHDNANAALWGLINESATERRMPVGQSLAFGVGIDNALADLVAAVIMAKDQAVEAERFSDAKTLKGLLQKCRMAGGEITQLQAAKSQAVSVEDYDTAAQVKRDIDTIKRALHQEARRSGLDVPAVDRLLSSSVRPSQSRPRTAERPSLPPSPPSSKHASPPKPHHIPEPTLPPAMKAHQSKVRKRPEHSRSASETGPLPFHPSQSATDASSHFSLADRPAATEGSSKNELKPGISPDSETLPPVSADHRPPPRSDSPPIPTLQKNVRAPSPPVPALANAIAEPARSSSPPVPALAKPVDKKPLWYEQEYPDPDAPPPVAKVIHRAPRKIPTKLRQPLHASGTTATVSTPATIDNASADVPARKFSPKKPAAIATHSNAGHVFNGDAFPPGFEPPEPISDRQTEEFTLAVEAFGEPRMRALLGRQFGLREWALQEVATIVRNRTSDPADDSKQNNKVDANSLAEAAYLVVQFALADPREKIVLGGITLWENITAFCARKRVPQAVSFRYFDALVPILLSKAGEMNPRVKEACMNMMALLGTTFHDAPYSIYTYVFRPLDKKTAASWKLVRARLDILHRLLNSGTGVVMSNPTTKPVAGKKPVQHSNKDVTSAIPTVKAIMEFTEPYLHHMNVEVREAAGHVVVDVMQATGGEDAVAPFLKKLRPQQLSSVRALFAAANGAPLAAAAAKGRAPGPWVQKPTKTVGASAEAGSAPLPGKAKVQSSEDAAEVALLQTERDDLKVQVDAQQRKTIAESNAKHHLGEQSDASSPSPTKGFWKGKKSTAPSPVKGKGEPKREVPPAASWNIDRTCIFCEELNDGFASEDRLDHHYWHDCPMLTNCPQCKMIVEIPMLTEHLVSDCVSHKSTRLCPRCHEPVSSAEFTSHVAKQQCIATAEDAQRCPMCHADILAGEAGWKSHLQVSGCPGSPRKPRNRPSPAHQAPVTSPTKTASQTSPTKSSAPVRTARITTPRHSPVQRSKLPRASPTRKR